MWSFSIVESRRSTIRCRILSPSVFSSSSVISTGGSRNGICTSRRSGPAGPADGCRDGDGACRPDPGGELRRLKICAARDCTAAVMDLSRNQSRIFCDTGNCGNRLHVAAYRERRAKEA